MGFIFFFLFESHASRSHAGWNRPKRPQSRQGTPGLWGGGAGGQRALALGPAGTKPPGGSPATASNALSVLGKLSDVLMAWEQGQEVAFLWQATQGREGGVVDMP